MERWREYANRMAKKRSVSPRVPLLLLLSLTCDVVRDGREKISHVTKSWATLTSQEFVELKAKLGV
jgi:hypothetical protein